MVALTGPLGTLRRHVTGDVQGLLGAEPLPAAWFERTPDDPGLFTDRDIVWRIHANRAGLIGGLRALMLQTLHPLAMAGIAQHSDYRTDPWGRLRRTAAFIGVTTYGTTSAAEATIASVRRIHDRVEGVAPDGRSYRANDPDLLAWVHNTEVDSFLRAHLRFGGPLSTADQDRYVAEMARIGERLGVIEAPRSRAELRHALIARRPELAATADARAAVRFLLWPPLPTYLRPAYGVLVSASVGLLPGFARRSLRLPVVPLSDPLLVQPAARVLLAGLGLALQSDGEPEPTGADALSDATRSPSASARPSRPTAPARRSAAARPRPQTSR